MQLDIATRVIGLVASAAPDTEAEVLVEQDALALTRFANSAIHQNVAEVTTTVRLRVHAGGRTASGSTTLTGPDSLADLVARTLAAARLCPIDDGWPGLAPIAALSGTGSADPAVVDASPTERAALVAAFVDATGGLTAAGYCRTRHVIGAFANSAGQAVSGETAEVAMDGIARTPSSDGAARLAAPRMADLDGAVLGARAATKARAGANPVELAPGRYEVVLEPTAVADLLQNFAMYAFDGKAVNEGYSCLAVGTAQFDPAVTLYDDGTDGATIGLPFDTEGTPKQRVDLVTAGVAKAPVHNRRTARQAGVATTGNAMPGIGDDDGRAAAAGLTLAAASGGGAVTEVDGPAADSAVAALVAGVERGILVTDHWYTRVLDPRTLVMTGLTRNGVWLIENGEVSRALRNFRFTQSYPRALEPGAVLGVGTATTTLPNSWMRVAFRAPALRLRSWNFTGGASG